MFPYAGPYAGPFYDGDEGLEKDSSRIQRRFRKSSDENDTRRTTGSTASTALAAPSFSRRTVQAFVKGSARLKPYQERVLEKMQREDVHGLVVAHALGRGKTLTAIAVADWFLRTVPDGKVFVISPKSLLKNFRDEKISKFDGVPPDSSQYLFVTKQTFSRGLLNRAVNEKTLLIIDEAHNYRTQMVGGSGKEVTAAIESASRAKKVLLLTGTPVYNRPYDICNLVAMVKGEQKALSPEQFGVVCSSDEALKMFLTLPETNPPVPIFDLHLPDTSGPDFPQEIHEIIRIPMTQEFYQLYRQVERQNHPSFQDESPWIFLNGVRQAMNQIDGTSYSDKVETAFNITREATQRGERVLLYSAFLDKGVFLLQEKFAHNNMLFMRITGDETLEDRRRAVEQYNHGTGSILIVSKAGGEGLNLIATRVVILLESGWNEPGERQVIGRAIRYKSHSHLPVKDRSVTVYRLLLVKPPEELRDEDDRPSENKHAKESADDIVHAHNMRKAVHAKDFMDRVSSICSEMEATR